MPAFLRLLGRPFSALMLIVLLVPAAPADCLGLAGGAHEPMPCCANRAGIATTLDGGCCSVRDATPLREQPPLSPSPARRNVNDGGAAVVLDAINPVSIAISPGDAPARTPGSPSGPLYLRFSNIRC
jgi:hypothetical protein